MKYKWFLSVIGVIVLVISLFSLWPVSLTLQTETRIGRYKNKKPHKYTVTVTAIRNPMKSVYAMYRRAKSHYGFSISSINSIDSLIIYSVYIERDGKSFELDYKDPYLLNTVLKQTEGGIASIAISDWHGECSSELNDKIFESMYMEDGEMLKCANVYVSIQEEGRQKIWIDGKLFQADQ